MGTPLTWNFQNNLDNYLGTYYLTFNYLGMTIDYLVKDPGRYPKLGFRVLEVLPCYVMQVMGCTQPISQVDSGYPDTLQKQNAYAQLNAPEKCFKICHIFGI